MEMADEKVHCLRVAPINERIGSGTQRKVGVDSGDNDCKSDAQDNQFLQI